MCSSDLGAVVNSRHSREDEARAQDEAIRLLNEVVGAEVSPRYLPSMLTGLAGRLGDLWGLLSRRPPLFCSETTRVMTQDHRYDGGKATRVLGLEYTDVTETLADTVAWFREEGLLGNHS